MMIPHGSPTGAGVVAALDYSYREAEMFFRQLIDAAPFMIWLSGPDTLCTHFNKVWLEFRGRTLEQEMGSGWVEGVHAEDVDGCLEAYLSAFNARKEFRLEYRLRRADGSYRWILDVGAPRFAPNGDFLGYMGSCNDITDTHRARLGLAGKLAVETPSTDPDVRLTPREQQILTLVASGYSTKEAAAVLNISFKTADSHRTRIMDKLNLHDVASLVRYAIRRGMIEA